MAICDVCGNNYERSFEVVIGSDRHVFDCFQCAIHALAPRCPICSAAVIGHGVETEPGGAVYCSGHCAGSGSEPAT